MHHTPKHASWPHMAEFPSRRPPTQCLDPRPHKTESTDESLLEERRNSHQTKANGNSLLLMPVSV